jgi:hypothetical protein
MAKPYLPFAYDGEDDDLWKLVWRKKFNNRYLAEVIRVSPRHCQSREEAINSGDIFKGRLHLFDHENGDQEISSWPVKLTGGAIFWPEAVDTAVWLEKIQNFIIAYEQRSKREQQS